MKKIGYIFPGQGAQYVGMGLDLYEKYQPARDIFDTACATLGFDLKKICFQAPKEELSRTDISQPAVLTVSVAALRALEEEIEIVGATRRVAPTIAAGLSLGEYSALVAAGVLSFENAVSLVYKRGKFMQEASLVNKGAMASVLGLSKETLGEICQATGVQIANLNSPGQIVISGLADNIDRASQLARAEGAAKVVVLDVSGPFHSKYMEQAAIKLDKELESVMFLNPKFGIIANVTADYQDRVVDIKSNLVRQVASPVLWEDSMRLMIKDGIADFFEIGPGNILKGLARSIDPNIKVYNIGKVKEIEVFVSETLNSKS